MKDEIERPCKLDTRPVWERSGFGNEQQYNKFKRLAVGWVIENPAHVSSDDPDALKNYETEMQEAMEIFRQQVTSR